MSFDYDVFLSYSSKDREQVAEIARRLQADGLRVWFDRLVLSPGAHIPTAIEEGLERSRTEAAFLSHHAFGSDWVGVERGAFLIGDPRNLEGRFLPVLLAECEPPKALKAFRMLLYYQDPEGAYRELLAAIHRAAQASPSDRASGLRAGAAVPSALARRARQFPRLACPGYLQHAWSPAIGVARGGR